MRAAHGPPLAGHGDCAQFLKALEVEYGASFTRGFSSAGGAATSVVVAHIPRVRLAPGPRGVRSVTVRGESLAAVLDALAGIIAGAGLTFVTSARRRGTTPPRRPLVRSPPPRGPRAGPLAARRPV